MKRSIISIVAIVILSLNSFGQAPEGFKYQAVVRNASSTVLANQAVGVRLSIQQGSIGGIVAYSETFSPTTNEYGLVNLEIGMGVTSYDFTTIDWTNGPYFVETAIDITGGTSYVVMGTSQLMSVPYALHANTADNVINDQVDDADADSNNEIQSISKTGTTVTLSNGGGSFQDSEGVYTAGSGINIINNEVSTSDPVYTIGLWPELGGYVFWVSADGKHGLVSETQDQGAFYWYAAQNLISNPLNHSVDAQSFRDWRLPTLFEMGEMYLQKNDIGGFANGNYWSSTQGTINFYAWAQNFVVNSSSQTDMALNNINIRSVRSF